MQQGGTRVSLRAVLGGMFLLGMARFLAQAQEDGRTMWVLAACFGLLLLSAIGLFVMFHKTRADRKQRGLRRWLLETLKLTGTVIILGLLLVVLLRGYSLLAR